MGIYEIEEFYQKLFSMSRNNILVELEEFLDSIKGRQAYYDICKSFAKLIIKYRNKEELLINFRSECAGLINMINKILQNQNNIDVVEFYNAISFGVSSLVFWDSEEESTEVQYKFEKQYLVLFSQGLAREKIQEHIINSIEIH